MLAKLNRLPAGVILKNFSSFSNKFFYLKVSKNNTSINRFGFVVGKSVDKRATRRNKIKRQFRSFFEKNCDRIKQGNDFLFRIKSEANDRKTDEVYSQLEEILKKGEFIK